MSGLTIILAEPASARAALAMQLAMAQAALGGAACLYLHDAAAGLAGDPLIVEALAAGVRVMVCQTGLADTRLCFDDLPDGVEAGGLVSLLADLRADNTGADQIVVV